MKQKNILTMCAMAAMLCLSSVTLMAQNDNGGGGGGGGGGRGGGNFDPAQFQQQMQQRQITNIRTQLGLTNDADWSAIQALVQKVLDDKRALGTAGNSALAGFGGGRRGGQGGGNRLAGLFGQTSVEAQALQKALDDDAPAAQIKDALDKYEASQKTKLATLATDQEALRGVLSVNQEATATLLGLLP
jgi:hypothetical protein